MPTVSVIIPVYNVEAYLRRCVDSVRSQTLEDLQIILVDDGSPDGCPGICDDYATQDPRIQVIHKENGGISSARNAGLELARGEYVFFLDSDDYMEPDGLELLVRTIEQQQVDFVRFRAIRTGWPGLPEHAPCILEPEREIPGGFYDRERMAQLIYPKLLVTETLMLGPIVGAWGSLYRRTFLEENRLRFDETIRFSEDVIFSAQVVLAAKAFYYIDTPCVYHYVFNPNSISKSFRPGRWDACRALLASAGTAFPEPGFRQQRMRLGWFCIFLALNERRHLPDLRDRARYCREILQSREVGELALLGCGLKVSWKQYILMLLVKCRAAKFFVRI